ncbi:MAG: alanine dehydrogenase [Acidimicrobiales bacterium]
MIIGVPREIKDSERRVGLSPASVAEAVGHEHTVLVETGAGEGSGFSDADYSAVGAEIEATARSVFERAELIVKVKEPQASERAMLGPRHTLFTYLHLAPDPDQARELMQSGATCIAYETVTDARGGLPLLAPMSQVAGRLAVQAGAHCLEGPQGGSGILLGGVPGVVPGHVVVIGGGVVGSNAIEMAIGLGADVTVLDRDAAVLGHLADRFGPALRTVYSTLSSLTQFVIAADLVIGAVLVPGAAAPKLVTAQHVSAMRPGSVVVDVAIDQGGCIETSHPTTHSHPTFVVDDVVHYCVANMPGAVPRTSTLALNNATLPFVMYLADHGIRAALRSSGPLRDGLNIHRGHVTEPAVAAALGVELVTDPDLS